MVERVELYLYDLSQGMAKMLSMRLTGKQIDGIWHTSVVVYGKEYAYGRGIEEFTPGVTPYGAPVEKISMGNTEIPKDVLELYIENMKSIWTPDKYHLLDNNCNSFTDQVCQFLVGRGIPAHITGLPAQFMETPFGQQLRPFIESMFGPSAVNPNIKNSNESNIIIHCTNLVKLEQLIQANRCVAIDFTSKTCPPCSIISPVFENFIFEANQDKSIIIGISVETSVAREISQKYEIFATPTFMFFLDGKKFSEFKGADKSELKSSIDFLLYTAYPPHTNSRLPLKNLVELTKSNAVHFTSSSDLTKIFDKLRTLVLNSNPKFSFEDIEVLKNWMLQMDFKSSSSCIPRDWHVVPCKLLTLLSINELFPLLDILRLISLNELVSKFFLYEDSGHTLERTIDRVLKGNAGMPTKLMLLKFLTNLFSNSDVRFNFRLISNHIRGTYCMRDLVTAFVVENLLAPEFQLRQASALLLFNISWTGTQIRRFCKLDCVEYDEHWVSELLAALSNAIVEETQMGDTNDEIAFRLIASLGLLLPFTTHPIIELAQVVGVETQLNNMMLLKPGSHGKLIKELIKEIKSILQQQESNIYLGNK